MLFLDLQDILNQQKADIRRKPFINDANKLDKSHFKEELVNEVTTTSYYLDKISDQKIIPTIKNVDKNSESLLQTPLTMCPDGSDALLSKSNQPILCGAVFDGHELCPRGYYCSIDSERNGSIFFFYIYRMKLKNFT